jgi:hypothetical protein
MQLPRPIFRLTTIRGPFQETKSSDYRQTQNEKHPWVSNGSPPTNHDPSFSVPGAAPSQNVLAVERATNEDTTTELPTNPCGRVANWSAVEAVAYNENGQQA